jgi:hypothetical protein
MGMWRAYLVITFVIFTVAAAHAFGLGLGGRFGKLGTGSLPGAASPSSVCIGTIDASAGCPLPMIGM